MREYEEIVREFSKTDPFKYKNPEISATNPPSEEEIVLYRRDKLFLEVLLDIRELFVERFSKI